MARHCRSLRRCGERVAHEACKASIGHPRVGGDPVNPDAGDYWMPAFRGHDKGKKSPEETSQMPIKYDELMALKNLGQKYAYTDREGMLYAYSVGMGADPMDEKELAFVNEAVATPRALKVVPTFASVAAWGAGPGEMNLNRVMVVDGERDITFHKPFPTAAHITADSSVLAVYDKGKDKGAVIRHQTVLKDADGEPLATLVASRFARGDGGFGGPSEGQPEPHQVPSRAPDKI